MQHVETVQPTRSPFLLERTARLRWLGFVLILLLAGFAAGWLIRGSTPREGSPEVTFARDMSAHHDQAVEMALILRDRTQNEALRALTLDIMLTQQGQRGQMEGWLAAWGRPLSKGTPMAGHAEMMGMASQQDVNRLQSLPVGAAEQLFLELMIRHHQGGVTMAQQALEQTRRPEVARLASAIVRSQASEITYLQHLLAERAGGTPSQQPEPAPSEDGQHP